MKYFIKIILLFIINSISIFPAPGDFVKDIIIKDLLFEIPVVKKEELSPGVSYYGDSRGEFPIVYLDIHFYSGNTISQPVEIPALIADSLKYGGSVLHPDETLVSQIESMGGTFGVATSGDKFTVKVSFLSRDQEKVLKLVKELLENPAFTGNAFENSKKKLIEGIKRRNERTESLGFRKIKEVLFRNFAKGIPYSIESIEKISITDISSHYKEIFSKRKKAIVVSGKFDEPSLKAWLLNTIPNTDDSSPGSELITTSKLMQDFKADFRKEFFIDKKVNQSMLIYSGVIPEHNHKDYFAIQLLNYIIGGGGFNSYMMQKIREEKGLAYSAASYPVVDADYGVIYFYTLTKNESLKEAHQILKEILSKKTFEAIQETELRDAKNAILNQFVFLFTNKHTILENQLEQDDDRLPPNYLNTYKDRIHQVTLDDLKRVGSEYFQEDKLKFLVVSSKENITKNYTSSSKIYQPEDSVKQE
jgi:zinc protease